MHFGAGEKERLEKVKYSAERRKRSRGAIQCSLEAQYMDAIYYSTIMHVLAAKKSASKKSI